MNTRILALLLGSACLSTACVDASARSPTAPEGEPSAAAASAMDVTRMTATIEHTVRQPCTGQLVDLSGRLMLELRTRALGTDRSELRYTAESMDVTGEAQSGGGTYRLAGAATGRLTAHHGDRAVTAADFTLIAAASPGVAVGRARVPTRVEVTIAFPVSTEGGFEAPEIAGVYVGKECGGLP